MPFEILDKRMNVPFAVWLTLSYLICIFKFIAEDGDIDDDAC